MGVLACDEDRPMRGAPTAILDFETTGTEPGMRHPVQIAVLRCRLGDDLDPVWQTLVRPPVPIPAEAAAVHGITDDRVADAPPFRDVATRLLELLDGHILCAYNLPFDHAVLTEALADEGRVGQAPPLVGLDPLVWAKVVDKYERGKRLEDVAGRRGITFPAHDAAADVTATARVMPLLLRELALSRELVRRELHHLDRFWRWQRRTALTQEQEYRDWRRRNSGDEPTMAWHAGLRIDPDEPTDTT